MKKLALLAFMSALTLSGVEFEKEGFLTTDSCASKGMFADCYLENYACGSTGCFKHNEPGIDKEAPLVLFVHDDGVIYKLDTSAIDRGELLENVSRNKVSMIGEYDAATNTIKVKEFKAPPPPTKSFFKGCL